MPMMFNPFTQSKKRINPLEMLEEEPMQFDMPFMEGMEDQFEPPPTPMREEYMAALMDSPQQEDFAPSTGRKILASLLGGLSGIGQGNADRGLATSRMISEGPYRGAVQKHLEKLAPLKEAEDIERNTIKEKQTGLKDKYRFMKDKNTHMMNAMKAESLHRKRMADIENIKEDNKRAEAVAKERERHNKVLEELRGQYQAFQKTRESNREGRFNRAQNQRERFHNDKIGNEKPIPVAEQKRIRNEAIESVRNDERFSEFWHPDDKHGPAGFHIPPGDEDTKQSLGEAVIKAEEKIAKKTRTDYSKAAIASDPFGYFNDEDEDEDEDEEEY